ncbi:MAG: hypothetical protein E7504_06390 [Ruminococcus sp.]|nr:hypothetical protein [Ruminococcus sp.]
MRKYMTKYERYLQDVLNDPKAYDISAIRTEIPVQIAIMQHERLIHLLVTMLFALLFMISLGILLYLQSLAMLLLTILLLALLIPYIMHYYFLENTVQKMYLLYNRIAALDDNTAYPNTDMSEK